MDNIPDVGDGNLIASQPEKEKLLEMHARFLQSKCDQETAKKVGEARDTHEKALNSFAKYFLGVKAEILSPGERKEAANILLTECKKFRRRFLVFSAALASPIYFFCLSSNKGLMESLIFSTVFSVCVLLVCLVLNTVFGIDCRFGAKCPFGLFSAIKFIKTQKILERFGKEKEALLHE